MCLLLISVCSGRDEEEREEQWLVFCEAIAAKSSVTMPKPKVSPQKGAQGGSGINFAALSPIRVESTTSLEALKVEYSLVQSAVKGGHKDAATIQRGRQVFVMSFREGGGGSSTESFLLKFG